MAQLQPRRDVWEQGFLPLNALWPQLDGLQSLLQIHNKLLERASPTPTGQWVLSPSELASVMELTSTQLEILCEVLGALSVFNGSPPDRPPAGSELVYVHELSLFMFVQLFSKESQRAESMEVWPEAGPSSVAAFGMDGLLSPTRAMTVRTSLSGKATVRQQLQQHLRHQTQQLRGLGDYLRRNIKVLTELCLDLPPSTQQPGTQRLVRAMEVDRLRFVLMPSSHRQGCSVSSLLPGLHTPGATVPLDTVVASLRQLWFEEVLQSPRIGASSPAGNMALMSPMAKASRHLGLVAPAGQVDETSISGVYKGTVVRGESDLANNGSLRITDCHDAVIYALAPVQCVYVSSCSESTIVIGAAGGMVRLERCEKVTLIAAAARVAVSSCHDCVLHLGTPRPPLLIGDCRFIRLAPFNTRYERQLAHVAAAGLRLDCPNRWDSPLLLVGKERRVGSSSGGTPDSPRAGSTPSAARGLLATTFSLLQPEELLPFVIPFQGTMGLLAGGPAPPHATAWRQMVPGGVVRSSAASEVASGTGSGGGGQGGGPLYLFPLPAEYERALHKKLAMTSELRQRFRQAALSKDREFELNNAIQAYFKEWLSSGNMLRQIYDLSNLEKDESSPPHDNNSGPPSVTVPPPNARDKVTLSL